jgi:A/G-specific adenine glycosylase
VLLFDHQACPVSSHCLALAEELKARSDGAASAVSVTQYPYKPPKAKQREESVVVCVIERRQTGSSSSDGDDNQSAHSGRSSFLLVQRPDSGLLASLWDFPSVNLGLKKGYDDDGVPRAQARRAIDSYLARLLGGDHPVCRAIQSNEAEEEDEKKGKGSAIKVERTDVGQATFLFSHIKHFYDVEWIRITDATTSGGDDDDDQWQPPARATAATTTKRKTPNKKAKTTKAKRKRKDDDEEADEEQEQEQEGEAVMRWLGEEELKEAAIPKGMKNCFALVEASRHRKGTPTPQKRRKTRPTADTSNTKQRSIDAFFNKKQTS